MLLDSLRNGVISSPTVIDSSRASCLAVGRSGGVLDPAVDLDALGGQCAAEHVGGVELRLPDRHPLLADRGAERDRAGHPDDVGAVVALDVQRVGRPGRAGGRGVDQLDDAVRRDQRRASPAHRPSLRAGSRRSPYRSRSRCSGRASARRSGRCSRTARRPRPSCHRAGRGRSTCRRRSGHRRRAGRRPRAAAWPVRRNRTPVRSGRRTP